MADVVERLRAVTEDDAYASPWTFGETCREAAAEIKTLRAERSALVAVNDRLVRSAESLRARLSQAGAGGGVVVRPLEWKPMQPGWTTSVADSVFGRYVAGHGYWKRPDCETAVLGVTNLDEGKAAAQADYSARIIAALAPSPSAPSYALTDAGRAALKEASSHAD